MAECGSEAGYLTLQKDKSADVQLSGCAFAGLSGPGKSRTATCDEGTVRLMSRSRSSEGFSLIETMVAVAILMIVALALTATFVGAAEQTRRADLRTKAIEAGKQQLDRIRSLSYDEATLTSADAGLDDPDWADTYCPVRDGSGNARCSDFTNAIVRTDTSARAAADVTHAKRSVTRNTGSAASPAPSYLNCGVSPTFNCGPVTTRRNGIILYTYIYYNSWTNPVAASFSPNPGQRTTQYKIATVVARFLDPKSGVSGSNARQYASVRMSAVIADVPEIASIR